jgi:hypothetical protein
MTSQDLQAVVAAWQAGAISQDTMFELFRSGEILPEGRSNEEEEGLIRGKRKTEIGKLNGWRHKDTEPELKEFFYIVNEGNEENGSGGGGM